MNESLENSQSLLPDQAAESVTAAPVTEAQRLKRIDALRGVALLGILLINIPSFSMPNYFSESFQTNPATFNFWLSAVISIFVEGKMRALFGMLFGAGVVLFVTKKEQSGKSVTGLFYRRMFWLVLFGVIHAHVILWIGDILYIYGLCGMIIYLFRNVNPKYLCLGVPLVGLMSFGSGAVLYTYVRGYGWNMSTPNARKRRGGNSPTSRRKQWPTGVNWNRSSFPIAKTPQRILGR